MKPLFFPVIALLTMCECLFAYPQISATGLTVRVPAGDYSVGARPIRVAQAADLAIAAPAAKPTIERHKLSAEKPQGWGIGTHVDGLRAGGTPLPDCLVPTSVRVTLADGTEMTRDKDYVLDAKWAGFARIEGGRIGADVEVTIAYEIGLMRIDAIEVDSAGVAHLHRGEEKMTCPQPPATPQGSVAIANVFMSYHAAAVEPWQIFRITEPTFPPPKVDTSLVRKTLAKLRAGEPVTIVTWGDSVTVGGDVSSPEKAFAQLFPARLRERFPKSKITNHNAGIGATTSEMRLPGLQKEVLDFHPDLVTIEYVNDAGFAEPVMRARYAMIFKQIRDAGAEIILITPHFTMPDMMKKQHPRGGETRPMIPLLRDIAAQHHVALADTSKRWEHLDAEGLPYVTLLTNGINHPNDRGHEMFTDDLLSCFPQ